MPNNDEFNDLLRRAKAGDDEAIRDFLVKFEAGSADDGPFPASQKAKEPI